MKRSERRSAARVVVSHSGITDLAAAERNLDVAKGYLVSYRAREQHVTLGLNAIQVALLRNDLPAAQKFMAELFASPLREAREVVANRDEAMRIAVEALKRTGEHDDTVEAIERLSRLMVSAAVS